MFNESVCAVIVTYNRKTLLLECLESLRKQTRPLQGIYLIDNASKDGTPELLLEKGYITEPPPKELNEPWEKEFTIQNLTDGSTIRFHYVRMHENTGGSGGFYEGVKRGSEKGYDWLWLMDDDAEPKEDALEEAAKYFHIDCVAVANLLLDRTTYQVLRHTRGYLDCSAFPGAIVKPLSPDSYEGRETIKIDFASFVGILIKSKVISQIGYPKKEFFIYHDDVEYCIRLRSVGKILLVPKSIIFHKEAPKTGSIERRLLGRKLMRKKFNELRLAYYGIRNLVWLGKKCSENKFLFYYKLVKNLFKQILVVIVIDDNKFKRIRFIINAYFDGLVGNFDNEKPKRILYG